jgi:SAM-dependent methyltransferase/uncharacterized protein YbaR (Trm112 family)
VKLRLVDRLRCPTCAGKLELKAFESVGEERLVATGTLLCPVCRVWYPIMRHVPILLDFGTELHAEFASRHAGALTGYEPPAGRPRPGERMTQSSFSTEWLTVRDDDLTFTYTHRDREDFIRIELDRAADEPQAEGSLLDVGCGYGTEALLLHRVTGLETFGTDLNLSLLDSGPSIDREPLVHTVIASLFALPFPRREFDLVYSHGVLHHTFSSSEAFASIAEFVAPDGTLFAWVYAKADFERGFRLRTSAAAERALRPLIAAAPGAVQSAVVHVFSVPHFARYKRLGLNRQMWHYRNSVHSIRDRWTPRYAHRHEADEVEEWFRARGFDPVPVDAAAYERRFGSPLIGIGRRASRRVDEA